MTAKAAAYRTHLAQTLGELPATLDSARAGRASFGNVAMIGHLAGDVGVEQVAPLEHILVIPAVSNPTKIPISAVGTVSNAKGTALAVARSTAKLDCIFG